MPSPDNDSNLIIRFVNNTQNTHRAVIANSVGMVVLSLGKNYSKSLPVNADLNTKYERANLPPKIMCFASNGM